MDGDVIQAGLVGLYMAIGGALFFLMFWEEVLLDKPAGGDRLPLLTFFLFAALYEVFWLPALASSTVRASIAFQYRSLRDYLRAMKGG